jgi:hypothetical protein
MINLLSFEHQLMLSLGLLIFKDDSSMLVRRLQLLLTIVPMKKKHEHRLFVFPSLLLVTFCFSHFASIVFVFNDESIGGLDRSIGL